MRQTMHALFLSDLPLQECSSTPSVKPVLQEQLYEPSVLIHVWAHPPLEEEHSFISETQRV